ncbi:hypothetical protein K438DRAFT_1981902 [Mycena galopus ATCC 62051]|nr:hypothetical protein K438DRAFT_1981902 [Mycena galopus ATCC 62051]
MEKAWCNQCPELLDSGVVRFQVHDFFPPVHNFFTPQPVTDVTVFILRVVLHDWPDARPPRHTRDLSSRTLCSRWRAWMISALGRTWRGQVEGAEKMLAPAPLLANLDNASAHAYWMDLTMQVTFNGQERTLCEIVALALSAGCTDCGVRPASTPCARLVGGAVNPGVGVSGVEAGQMQMVECASSRRGTPTFGSRA